MTRTSALAAIVCLLAGPFLLWPAPARAQDVEVTAERREELTGLYQHAQDHYLAKRYTEALPEFEQVARELKSANAQLYVARCHRQLGRLVEAHAAMSRTVEMATEAAAKEARFEKTRDEAVKELAELEREVGRVVVRLPDAPEGTVIEIAGQAVPLDQEVVVAPGEVRVDAMVPNEPLHRQTIQVRPATVIDVRIALPSEPPPPAPVPVAPQPQPLPPTPEGEGSDGTVRVVGYVALGVGVAGMTTFTVAGLMANALYDDIEEKCGGGPCTDPAFNPEIDEGRTRDLVANIGLGIGIGGLVAGTLMVIFGGADEPTTTGLSVDPRGLTLRF